MELSVEMKVAVVVDEVAVVVEVQVEVGRAAEGEVDRRSCAGGGEGRGTAAGILKRKKGPRWKG